MRTYKISIYYVDITRKNISKIKRAFSGNRKLATVNSISILNNMIAVIAFMALAFGALFVTWGNCIAAQKLHDKKKSD